MMSTDAKPIFFTFPDFMGKGRSFFTQLESLNPDLNLLKISDNQVQIQEKEEAETEYLVFRTPEWEVSEKGFEIIQECNEEIRFEWHQYFLIYKSMGGIIGAITVAIIISLGAWAMAKRAGRVYSEDTDIILPNPDDPCQETWRKADVSFISYESAGEEEQKKFKKAIRIPPDLVVEIVSSKGGLKPALWKMKYFWMRTGVKLGLVVCPFSKLIYIFEKGKEDHKEQSIYLPFRHPLLPDYIGFFGQYVDEVE
jgi:Uma2 family endonuclease